MKKVKFFIVEVWECRASCASKGIYEIIEIFKRTWILIKIGVNGDNIHSNKGQQDYSEWLYGKN